MTPMHFDNEALPSRSDGLGIRMTFGLVMVAYLISGIYASISCRGLFQDGAYYLYRLAEREWFYLYDPNRLTVHVLRQAPVVAMLKLGEFSLVDQARVFSLAMLLLPPLLVGLCWFIPPRESKIWTIVPLVNLLVGFSTMSFEAVGEAAIAVSYFWVLLFLLLFRTRQWPSQLMFLVLCLPAFQLHEGACLLMPVFFLAIAMRFRKAGRAERIFLGCVAVLFAAMFSYQLKWMMYPRIPGDREGALRGILTFGFLYFDGHLNLPALTALAAVAGLAVLVAAPRRWFRRSAAIVVVAFSVIALIAIAVAWMVPASLSPAAQSLSRYNPVFAAVVLGAFATLGANGRADISLARVPALCVVLILCLAQTAIDLAVTTRWRRYIADLEQQVAQSHGLVDWQGGRPRGSDWRDEDWRLMTVGWVHPIMSIILARNGEVQSILDYPPQTQFRPIDLSDPNRLPKMHGISYEPYRRFYAADGLAGPGR